MFWLENNSKHNACLIVFIFYLSKLVLILAQKWHFVNDTATFLTFPPQNAYFYNHAKPLTDAPVGVLFSKTV